MNRNQDPEDNVFEGHPSKKLDPGEVNVISLTPSSQDKR